jgi:hypothetical protein
MFMLCSSQHNMSFVGKWMELQIITLSEISQTKKDKNNVLESGNYQVVYAHMSRS